MNQTAHVFILWPPGRGNRGIPQKRPMLSTDLSNRVKIVVALLCSNKALPHIVDHDTFICEILIAIVLIGFATSRVVLLNIAAKRKMAK